MEAQLRAFILILLQENERLREKKDKVMLMQNFNTLSGNVSRITSGDEVLTLGNWLLSTTIVYTRHREGHYQTNELKDFIEKFGIPANTNYVRLYQNNVVITTYNNGVFSNNVSNGFERILQTHRECKFNNHGGTK
jgi:hypothetical protein